MELHAVTGSRSVPSTITAAPFPGASASSVKAAPEHLAAVAPPVAASTSNTSLPSSSGNLQQVASTQVNAIAILKQSSSGVGATQMGPEKSLLYSAGGAGRAIIPPDQDYHPTYQLQQFMQPAQRQDVPPADFDSDNSTLLQMQIAGITSPVSDQVYQDQSSADQIPQYGQHMLLSHNVDIQRSGKLSLQEQLAEVQKQLQLLSSGHQAQAQPYASQGLQPHVQFNSDTQWGTVSAADNAQENMEFFA
jgi:hypothetical protein